MKVFSSLLLAVSSLFLMTGKVLAVPTYYALQSSGGCVDGCIGLKNNSTSPGTRLKLLACSGHPESIQWRLDIDGSSGRFRSRLDPNMCIQAGRGGDYTVVDGFRLRIRQCSDSVMQRFDMASLVNDYGDIFGPMKLEAFPDFCAVHRGINPHIGRDPIIMKRCDGLDEMRAYGWEGDLAY